MDYCILQKGQQILLSRPGTKQKLSLLLSCLMLPFFFTSDIQWRIYSPDGNFFTTIYKRDTPILTAVPLFLSSHMWPRYTRMEVSVRFLCGRNTKKCISSVRITGRFIDPPYGLRGAQHR
ncbi:hypothetical protein TNCV_1887061 [Trichonephila clavipes]|nr:hypothetical protein TNCV_1887061 [Trichonephila clavipes]